MLINIGTYKVKKKRQPTREQWAEHVLTTIAQQGWRSGESTRLPPMWPGFDS